MCLVTQWCSTLCDPMDWSSSIQRFSTQEYWSGLPFHPPEGKKNLHNTHKNITGGTLKGTQTDDVTAQQERQVRYQTLWTCHENTAASWPNIGQFDHQHN